MFCWLQQKRILVSLTVWWEWWESAILHSSPCELLRITHDASTHAEKKQKKKPAHRGLKQLPRRNQIKMRLDLILVFLCHFFFCFFFFFLVTHFPVLLQERQKGREERREGWLQSSTDRYIKKKKERQTASASKQLSILCYIQETHTLVSNVCVPKSIRDELVTEQLMYI